MGTLVFVPLMVAVVLLLLRGTGGTSASISRVALAVFAVVYTAWEVLIGIGTGILVDEVNQLTEAERTTGAMLVEEFSDNSLIMVMETIGACAWLVALVAAGIALVRQAGASWLVPVLLALSAVPNRVARLPLRSSRPRPLHRRALARLANGSFSPSSSCSGFRLATLLRRAPGTGA